MKHIKTTIVALASILTASVGEAFCTYDGGGYLLCDPGQSGHHTVVTDRYTGGYIFTAGQGSWGSVSGPGVSITASNGSAEFFNQEAAGFYSLSASVSSDPSAFVEVLVTW